MGYMNKRPWLKRVITGALLGGLLLGTVGFAYAADSDTASTAVNNVKSKIKSMMPGGRGHGPGMGMEKGMGMNLDLAALVEDNVISSEESEAIQAKIDALKTERQAEMDKIKAMTSEERQAYFESKKAENNESKVKTDFLTTLVNENIISSDTADAIREAQQAQREEAMQNRLTEGLTTLVNDKTITSEQSDAILAALKEEQTARQAEMEKVKAMTDEERQTYFQDNKPAHDNCLADLVTAGTITQDQADAVQKAIGGPRGEGRGPGGGMECQGAPDGGRGPGGMGHGGMGSGHGPASNNSSQTDTE